MKEKIAKTNVARLLDKAKIAYGTIAFCIAFLRCRNLDV